MIQNLRLAAVCMCGFLCLPALSEEPKKFDVSGWGGLPLSDQVTSLWLNGPKELERPQPLLMVYFRGSSGWHKRKWDMDSRFGKSPAWIRLKSPDLVLSIEYDKQFHRIAVQEEPVDLTKANVFLVSPVGDPSAKAKIESLGLVSLAVTGDAAPPLVILERNPEIKRAVFGEKQ